MYNYVVMHVAIHTKASASGTAGVVLAGPLFDRQSDARRPDWPGRLTFVLRIGEQDQVQRNCRH